MFSTTLKYPVRDVVKKGTSLGIVIGNIDLMGDDMCQYLRG